MKELILIVSLAGGVFALILFIYFWKSTGDIILARSVAFATLGINSLVYVFSVRTLREPFWREFPFDNKWLNFAVIGGVVLQVAPFLFPQTREFLRLAPLTAFQWLLVFGASVLMFIIIEVSKVIFKRHLKDEVII